MPDFRVLRSVACPERRILLRQGEFMAPIGFGSDAEPVQADPAAAAPHCRVYFDGETLFATSSDPVHPVITAGRSLSTGWTPIGCPSILQLTQGGLVYEPDLPSGESTTERLWFASGELSATRTGGPPRPIPEVLRSPARDYGDVPVTLADLRKRLLFDPQKLGLEHAAAQPRLARVQAATSQSRAETAEGTSVPSRPRLGRWLRAEFQKTSKGMRLAFVALPIVAWGALAAGEPEDVAEHAGSRLRSTEARRPPSVTPQPSPTTAALAPSAAAPRAAGSPGAGGSRKRTLEARAAEALARGDTARAAVLYDELAAAAPGRPEFASAARILRRNEHRIETTQ